MTARGHNVRPVAMAALSVLVLMWLYSSLTGPTPGAPTQSTTASSTTASSTTASSTTGDAIISTRSGLPIVALSQLPAEAAETYGLILAGGPYPYSQDDGVFQNRERILPAAESGFYREYTIQTPGADDRGAQRFVVGDDGTVYYTGDHYNSFVQVRA